ncbi:MAG TPA: beta-N-acetylhexosaminidase [Porphyromonadaceae bacterium]|nr:beta-N-acetylhexosaminidase [Porphyromonadaceae bacterium]
MKKIKNVILSVCCGVFVMACSGGAKEVRKADYNIVPLPNEIRTAEGNPFLLSKETKIVFPAGNDKMKRNAEFLAEFLEASTGVKIRITSEQPDKNAIVLLLDAPDENPEAYRLQVDEKFIRIDGASEAGVFYGIQTLRKATPVGERISVAYDPVVINDAPRFGYRGMMLDVARHFEPVEFVKRFVDMLALHNINTFHWHLTEDQGWRIEIKAYPRLTTVGSRRAQTVIGKNTGEYDGKPHGGFYTQEEIKDIVAYAAERYITIIPEIDLPGHMLAALASYPELGCTGGPYEVAQTWGVFDDVLCPGKDSTFIFLEGVLSEVIELFPSKYIHIGGDECPKVRWEQCPLCQARIKELGLKDDAQHTAEHYLQSYVTARVEKFLNDRGRSIIGWDEILEGELAPNATVMSWRGMEGGTRAAQMGHDVIMTPTSHCYFDFYQAEDTGNEPFAIGGFLPVEKVYSFEPVPGILTDEQKKHILGAQANLWTEYVPNAEHVEYMAMPRIAAMSEVQWTQPEKKNYADFHKRLLGLISIYDQQGYHYARHIFDIKTAMKPDFEKNALSVTFSTIDNAPVYYTLDGAEPTEASTRYDGPLFVSADAQLKAAAIRPSGKNSRIFSTEVQVNEATFKPVVLLTDPAPNYASSGAEILVDGLQAVNTNFHSGKWIGFQENDLVLTIDLLQPKTISSAELSNMIQTGDWIFDVSQIIVESSRDGKTFSPAGNWKNDTEEKAPRGEMLTHTVTFDPVEARYFKITVKPSIIPAWHDGRGKRAFLFADEILLK